MTQVFGVQFGDAILQNAAHGVERTKDQDSISGCSRSNGRIEGFLRGRIGAGLGILASVQLRPAFSQLGG